MTVVKINAITVPAGSGDELARRVADRRHAVDGEPGFEGFELLRPDDENRPWLVVTRWRDEESFQAWTFSRSVGHAHGRSPGGTVRTPLATGAELWSYTPALDNR